MMERDREIYNGNKFMVNTGENTGVFSRDVDRLMHQYTSLRLGIYNQYQGYLPDPISKRELKSYIDEQFVRLVKEYDINSPVDFPGYIKTKLNFRVKNSYIKGEYRDRQRVFVLKNDFDVSNLLEREPLSDDELEYYSILEYVLEGEKLTEVEKRVLFLIFNELSDTEVRSEYKKKYPKSRVTLSDLREITTRMKKLLKSKLHESMEDKM